MKLLLILALWPLAILTLLAGAGAFITFGLFAIICLFCPSGVPHFINLTLAYAYACLFLLLIAWNGARACDWLCSKAYPITL
jgi:hypothetical protein